MTGDTASKPVAINYFKFYSKQDVLSLTRIRRFETKLGERLQVIADQNNVEQSLQASNAKFVIIGIPEDIGVKANYGTGGTDTGMGSVSFIVS